MLAPEHATERARHGQTLARLMAAQLEDQQHLLQLIQQHREAVRLADVAGMAEVVRRQQPIVRRLADLELQRQRVVGRLSELLRSGQRGAMTVADIADALGEPIASRLLALAAALRTAVAGAHRANSILAAAVTALHGHVAGVVQAVQAALGRPQVYSRGGRIACGAQVQFAVDLKT